MAAFNGQLEIMKYLEKEYNWSPHLKNIFGYNAYTYAKQNKHHKIIKHLENKMFYENLSKLVNEFVEIKDNEINKLTEKINLVKNFIS